MNHRVSNMALVCAALVVSIHVGISGPVHSFAWCLKEFIAEGVARIAVPFFFISGGYFLGCRYFNSADGIADTWKTTCLKRVRTICVPYWFWNLLYAPIVLGLALISDVVAGRACRSIPWVHTMAGIVGLSEPPLFPLWFLRSLMVFVVAAPALWWLVCRLRWIAPAMFYAIYLAQWIVGFKVPALIPLAGLAYFVLGMAIANGLVYSVSRKVAWWLFILALAIGFSVRWTWPEIDILPVWIPFVLFGLWSVMPDHPLNRALTMMSFPIYLLHMFVLLGLQYAWHLTAFMPDGVEFLFRWAVAVGLSMGISRLLVAAFPQVAGIVFGGRVEKKNHET